MEEGIRVLDRCFDVLELLAQSQRPMTLAEISKKSQISKSTAYRLLRDLNNRHYVEKDKNNAYTIGVKLYEIVSTHINGLELQTEAKPILSTLREELELTVHLGILQESDVVYIEKLEMYPATKVYAKVGQRSPAYCSSMGKCLLSCLSGEELEDVLEDLVFQPFTHNTIQSAWELKQHLRMVRRQGWAMDNEEFLEGKRCIGTPVFDYKGDAIASISASGTVAMITDERIPVIVEKLKEAALAISRRMGYSE